MICTYCIDCFPFIRELLLYQRSLLSNTNDHEGPRISIKYYFDHSWSFMFNSMPLSSINPNGLVFYCIDCLPFIRELSLFQGLLLSNTNDHEGPRISIKYYFDHSWSFMFNSMPPSRTKADAPLSIKPLV